MRRVISSILKKERRRKMDGWMEEERKKHIDLEDDCTDWWDERERERERNTRY